MLTGKAHPGYIYWKFLKVGVKFPFSCHRDCLKCVHKIQTSALKVARCSWVMEHLNLGCTNFSHSCLKKCFRSVLTALSRRGTRICSIKTNLNSSGLCTALGLMRFNTPRVTSTKPLRKLIFTTLTHVQDLTHLHMACFCFRPHFRIFLDTWTQVKAILFLKSSKEQHLPEKSFLTINV